MNRLLALSLLLASPALLNAQDWGLRAGDQPLSSAQMRDLTGRTLTFYDDGVSKYSAGGSYSYTYGPQNGGGTAFGTFEFNEDGSVCTAFRNGFSRCDLLVMNAGRMILITETGDRFPIRPDGN
jgi:hypothetical protein